ncbi:unnamed protein product [Amaranthus hypochondriacus]
MDASLPRASGKDAEDGRVGAGARPEWKGGWTRIWDFICRATALVVSFLSFILMVCVGDFTLYHGLSFVFAMAIVTLVYCGVQVGIKGHELRTKKYVISPKIAVWIDFPLDQVLAYMLFSSASVAARECSFLQISIEAAGGVVGSGFQLAAASTAMTFLLFLCLSFAALFSASRFFTRNSQQL